MPWKAKVHLAEQRQAARQQSRKQYDQDNYDKRKWYMQAAWRNCRRAFLSDPDNALCAHCKERGVIRPAVDVHHVKGRIEHPELAYDHSNMQGLCHACHSRVTASEARKGKR